MRASQKALADKLAELEERIQDHDEQITYIFNAIRQLIEGGHHNINIAATYLNSNIERKKFIGLKLPVAERTENLRS